jgi:hypothetical protein
MIKDASWQNLSVPKGGSDQFNKDLASGNLHGGGAKL